MATNISRAATRLIPHAALFRLPIRLACAHDDATLLTRTATTMVQLIIRHISGSRATQVDVIPLGAHRELILGRAASAAVRFDVQHDITVGRQHARIAPLEQDPTRFVLSDLQSRNGTFVNGVRVKAPVLLRPGDVVRLGQAGPELEVLIEVSLP